ncbi:MAG: hypothetical protein ABIJ37_01065 [Pseudomonadota bacterium]
MEKTKSKKHTNRKDSKGSIGYIKDKRDILKIVPKLRKVKTPKN